MITNNIQTTLTGLHGLSFKSFAHRVGAITTTETIKRLIEILPEFQNLLAIRENSNPSVKIDGDISSTINS